MRSHAALYRHPLARLIGSETTVRDFIERGYDVVGIESDMSARFLGQDASIKGDDRAPRTRCVKGELNLGARRGKDPLQH